MDIDAIEETVSILNEVDFSNPIRGANALEQMANSTTSSVAELGTKLQEISEEKYDIGS